MLAKRCLMVAGVYFVCGLSLGIAMGIAHNFALVPVHAHINLLGWTSLAIAAAVFRLWPQTAQTALASAFFWIYNLCLPVAMASLGLMLSGYRFILIEPIVVVSHLGVWLGGVLFAANLLRSLTAATPASEQSITCKDAHACESG